MTTTSPTRDYDVEARDHSAHRYAYDFDYRMHRFTLRTLQRHVVPGNALELGCYHGHFTQLLCAAFDEVDVVEASGECIEHAARAVQGKARFHNRTFETFEPQQRYANIFLIHTLEHLDQRSAVLRRIAGWLAPGGRLFVAAPNAHAASRQIAVQMGLIEHAAAITEAEAAHGHRVTYTLDTLSAEMRRAGLHVQARGGVVFKGLANFQMDKALAAGIIDDAYLEGAYQLGLVMPELCSTVYCVVSNEPAR